MHRVPMFDIRTPMDKRMLAFSLQRSPQIGTTLRVRNSSFFRWTGHAFCWKRRARLCRIAGLFRSRTAWKGCAKRWCFTPSRSSKWGTSSSKTTLRYANPCSMTRKRHAWRELCISFVCCSDCARTACGIDSILNMLGCPFAFTVSAGNFQGNAIVSVSYKRARCSDSSFG